MNSRLIDLCVCLAMIAVATSLGCKKPEPNSGIIGKRTTEIGEYDPSSGAEISDSEAKPTNPLNPLGALSQYDKISQKIAGLGLELHLKNFYYTYERYPESHEEFMEKVIKPNPNLALPVLSGGKEYQYDVKNHKLLVVEGGE